MTFANKIWKYRFRFVFFALSKIKGEKKVSSFQVKVFYLKVPNNL